MTDFAKRAADALALMPPELQQRAVEHLEEQAEKLAILRALVQVGLDDVAAGRVSDWNLAEFLEEMQEKRPAAE
jgi:hypothetical protein